MFNFFNFTALILISIYSKLEGKNLQK